MADNWFSQILYMSRVSQTTKNGFYWKKSLGRKYRSLLYWGWTYNSTFSQKAILGSLGRMAQVLKR